MSLRAQILDDIKAAMKAKDSKKLEVLRFVNAQIKNKEIEIRPKEVTDEDVTSVLKKFVKQRKEAMDQFQKAGREDLVAKDKEEMVLIETYLPEMLDEAKVKEIVAEVLKETGASSMKDMGNVMKQVLVKTGGQADGKLVSDLVKGALG